MLSEPAHAPLADELERRCVRERESRCHVTADEVRLAEAGQLEDPSSDGEHSSVLVADDEAGGRRRVVVFEELEEEAEAAAPTLWRVAREPLAAVDVDGALAAVRADEDRHGAIVGDSVVAPPLTRLQGQVNSC